MKSMKKILAALLCILMVLSMGVFASSAAETENQVIYFEVPSGDGPLNWEGAKLYCHIWAYGGDSFAQWQSKKEACVKTDTEGLWMYDITSKGFTLEEGVTYALIFSEGSSQTYDTLFDTTCLGDTLYCKGPESIIEAPTDSSKTALAAYWRNADPAKYGPVRQLTSLGNVVGECYAPDADAESLYTDFLKNKLQTTLQYVVMTEAELMAHASSQLGISAERAYELELEAGFHTPITNDELPLPSDPATGDQTETNRYYFYYPEIWESTDDEKVAGIYWWEGSDAPASWPGYKANKTDVEGVFYYDVPKDVITLIWNNFIDGGVDPEAEIYNIAQQTKNICSEYYEAGDSDTYPNGVDSFDGMIFVVDLMSPYSSYDSKHPFEGEWYYYYGNGEYGITPEKGDKVYTDSYLDEPLTPATGDEFAVGDVNADGKLNIKDATTIQKFVAKMIELDESAQARADYNADGKVNVKDATMIQKKIANLI